MRSLFISLLLLQIFALNLSVDLSKYYKTFMSNNGFPLEEHQVKAQDGYLLSVWHLKPKAPSGKVVFMQHGLADTAWTFFQLGAKSLPFLLLKEGFDVWLGNIRGNVFSAKLNPSKTKSEYTIDDFVTYDLPAMINHVKSNVGAKKMSYIGHSQGTTVFFMLTMHNPSLIDTTFDHFVALGTVPNIAHTKFAPIELLDKIYGVLKEISIMDSLSLSDTQRNLLASFCKISPGICGKFFDAGASIKPSGRMDYKNLYNFLYYFPGGTCKTNLLHWSQIHKMKKLVYYNPSFDTEKTAKEYNTDNLKKWKIKSLIARTDDDTFSSYQDVSDFYYVVENKSLIKLLDLKNYGHMDVLAANSAYNDVFLPIINFVKY